MNAFPSWLVIEGRRISLSAEIAGQLALLQILLRTDVAHSEKYRLQWAAEAEEVARRLGNATVTENAP